MPSTSSTPTAEGSGEAEHHGHDDPGARAVVVDVVGLDRLVQLLRHDGRTVIGPVVTSGGGSIVLDEIDRPEPGPGEVLIRVESCGICGSDLHIYNHGEAFGFEEGCRIGHEFVGVVEEVGPDVTGLSVGDKVLAPFWISCGECHHCDNDLHTSCVKGGCFGFDRGGLQVGGGRFRRVFDQIE